MLIAKENNPLNSSLSRNLESSGKAAKITGLLCIGCAAAAVGLGFFSANLYFLFLFSAAALGLLGYLEIEAVKKGLMSSVILLISGVIIILLFLFLFATTTSIQFRIFYALLSILIPVALTAFALAAQRVEIWKALIPISIPVFHMLTSTTANSKFYWLGFIVVPFSWGMLGLVAYLGSKYE